MDERDQESGHLKGKKERRWRRKTKRCERLTSMRTIIGERKPNDRYDVRSRDPFSLFIFLFIFFLFFLYFWWPPWLFLFNSHLSSLGSFPHFGGNTLYITRS